MDDTIYKSFEAMDEQDLAMIINQVGRRMLVLRSDVPDTSFWFDVLKRVSSILNSSTKLTNEEKILLANPPEGVNAKVSVIKSLRLRSGMRLLACRDIVNKYMTDNNLPAK